MLDCTKYCLNKDENCRIKCLAISIEVGKKNMPACTFYKPIFFYAYLISCNGNSYITKNLNEAMNYISTQIKEDGNNTGFKIEKVAMTLAEYNNLPEFTGW